MPEPPNESPTADVYAADLASPNTAAPDGSICVIDILADAEPGAFARIANVLNIAHRAPHQVQLEHTDDGLLRIHIELKIGVAAAQLIQRKLQQLTDVSSVDLRVRARDEE